MSDKESPKSTPSAGFADLKTFNVPVDSEHKSKVFKLWSWGKPHHFSFQVSWISFFLAFFATFAVPPLLPVIRENLDLTKSDVSGAAIASVTGAIFSRLTLGLVCDTYGPRYGHAFLQLLTSAATMCMAAVTDAAGFIVVRMVIGFSLATFVSCQFWSSVMFNVKVVGSANAFGAGWGNAGAGFTHLIMPFIYQGIHHDQPAFIAWRAAMFIPGSAQIIIGLIILAFAQDLPDGQYGELKKKGTLVTKSGASTKAAYLNYRTWLMLISYGYCFGVELTVDNNISPYLYDQFGLSLSTASLLGAVFSLTNIFARGLGGLASDYACKYFGMRGRLWTLWIVQTGGGLCSLLMFYTKSSLGLTMMIVAFWSILVPMACGASYGIVPFITKRGLGSASGMVGAGGNTGSAITQAIFFTSASMTTAEGFKWMGVMIIAVTTVCVPLVHFPIAGWGSMFVKGNPNQTEEDYFLKDFSEEEIKQGLHLPVLRFAAESKSQRGFKAAAELERQLSSAMV
jgi:NNP family nitrate/nitrite transporter-like MFS transporter